MKGRFIVMGAAIALAGVWGLTNGWRAPDRQTATALPRTNDVEASHLVAPNLRVALPKEPPGPTPAFDRDESLRVEARRRASRDLAATLQWLAGLGAGHERALAVEMIVDELARTDPAGAIEVAEYFQEGAGDGRPEHLVQLWTEANSAEAVAWIARHRPGPERDRLAARIAFVRAQTDPAEAVALVTAYVDGAPAKQDALVAVLHQWALRDPVAATAQANELTDLRVRMRALVEIEMSRRQIAGF
jgi:hypothetical protein